jgi:hypothetical protein
MAAKHKFTAFERHGVWKAHKEMCCWCERLIEFRDTTVDHIIPESLLKNPKKLEETKSLYELPPNFKINGFENWVPSDFKCNSRKNSKLYRKSPVLMDLLDRAQTVAALAKEYSDSVKRASKQGKSNAVVETLLERGEITVADLEKLIEDHKRTSASASYLPRLSMMMTVCAVFTFFYVLGDLKYGNIEGQMPIPRLPWPVVFIVRAGVFFFVALFVSALAVAIFRKVLPGVDIYSYVRAKLSRHRFRSPEPGWVVVDNLNGLDLVRWRGEEVYGVIPAARDPDRTWICVNCEHPGPWDGAVCLNCGNASRVDGQPIPWEM